MDARFAISSLCHWVRPAVGIEFSVRIVAKSRELEDFESAAFLKILWNWNPSNFELDSMSLITSFYESVKYCLSRSFRRTPESFTLSQQQVAGPALTLFPVESKPCS